MVSEDNHSSPVTSIEDDQTTSGKHGSRIERRSVLKLLGTSAVLSVAGTGSVTASDGGYGAGGYGEHAYGGESDVDEPSVSLENTILFDGVGTSGESRYEFNVTGEIEKSTYRGASIDESDTIDEGHVTGTVTGWRDAYRFSGEIETLTIDGQARVSVNGERVDPADYGGESSQVVTIVGNGTHSIYELATDRGIKVLEGGGTVVSEGRAEGTIQRDVHRYQLFGELIDFRFHEGGTHVYLEDQLIDPEEYDGEPVLPHAIVFDGTDASSSSRYSFTVDGDVAEAEYRGATIDGSGTIDGSSVDGVVDAGVVDAYWFDGAIIDFKIAGDAEVGVEYDIR